MENRINIAQLLKDCPKGMELDCTMFENLEFDHTDKDNGTYPIICRVKTEWGSYNIHTFTEYGYYSTEKYSKCVIFPKGKTTWDGFQGPFKDGDVIADGGFTAIFHKIDGGHMYYHCWYNSKNYEFKAKIDFGIGYAKDYKYATEDEKQKLFDAIKANGYKWNAKTKTLEKLVEPIFEVGNKIEKCGYRFTIAEVKDDYYLTKCGNKIPIDNQDDFSLVPNKFDITTLKPFDKVLVAHNKGEWHIQFFEKYSPTSKFPFICIGGSAYQRCVPYEAHKELLGTTNDCDEYYKTWK